MAYKMDANGNWHQMSTSTKTATKIKSKSKASKGNTSDTKKSIKVSDNNASDKTAYAEECNFCIEGDYKVRMGTTLKVRDGVAERWKGNWKILETTHTVDSKGYKTEGKAGRIPYKTETSKKKKTKKKKSSTKTTKTTTTKTKKSSTASSSTHYYKMDANGNWHPVSKKG